jgi:hypothetical protein
MESNTVHSISNEDYLVSPELQPIESKHWTTGSGPGRSFCSECGEDESTLGPRMVCIRVLTGTKPRALYDGRSVGSLDGA